MTIGFSAVDEQVICECFAVRAGEEVKSTSGIIVEQKKAVPELPVSGTVVSVGVNCPEDVKALVGREIALPTGQAAGVMVNVPDPDVVFGRIPKTQGRLFVAMHYKAVRVVYDDVRKPNDKPNPSTGFVSSLSLM